MFRLMLIAFMLLVGCASSNPAFDGQGLYAPTNDYRIRYEPGTSRLLGSAWKVTNFSRKDGKPDKALDGGAYRSLLRWTQQDGDQVEGQVRTYELMLSHHTNARIWLRLVPVPFSVRNKRIDVLAKNFVNGISGDVLTDFFSDGHVERRVATEIKSVKKKTVFGRQAAAVTFDIVNLNQLEMNKDAPRQRIELVLCEVPMVAEFLGGSTARVRAYPVVGYSNDAEHFDEHVEAFHKLLERMELGQRW